jgi:hypothetical protein
MRWAALAVVCGLALAAAAALSSPNDAKERSCVEGVPGPVSELARWRTSCRGSVPPAFRRSTCLFCTTPRSPSITKPYHAQQHICMCSLSQPSPPAKPDRPPLSPSSPFPSPPLRLSPQSGAQAQGARPRPDRRRLRVAAAPRRPAAGRVSWQFTVSAAGVGIPLSSLSLSLRPSTQLPTALPLPTPPLDYQHLR